jgi:hypothetical protein
MPCRKNDRHTRERVIVSVSEAMFSSESTVISEQSTAVSQLFTVHCSLISEYFPKPKRFHRNRIGRASFGAERATRAGRVVFEHHRERRLIRFAHNDIHHRIVAGDLIGAHDL